MYKAKALTIALSLRPCCYLGLKINGALRVSRGHQMVHQPSGLVTAFAVATLNSLMPHC